MIAAVVAALEAAGIVVMLVLVYRLARAAERLVKLGEDERDRGLIERGRAREEASFRG